MNYMTNNLFLIDTNILIYNYDINEKEKHRAAKELLDKCWRGEIKYAISSQTLAEFFVVVTRKIKQPLSLEEAQKIINDISEFPGWIVINYDKKSVRKAIHLCNHINTKRFWDLLIIATMLQNDIYNIYTENENDFNKVSEIFVKNPFN